MSQENIFLFIVGTAGSGKSSMTKAFSQWMHMQDLNTVLVNLDPGAEDIAYVPDVDIRDWISLPDVMSEYGLGPNGAQIVAADMMAMKATELADALEGFETNYVLIDTPGQLELFTFRNSSGLIVNTLGADRAIIAFSMDPLVAKSPNGLISQILLRATVQFRFMVPVIGVLTKKDLLTEEEADTIVKWASNAESMDAAMTEKGIGTSTLMNIELLRALENVGALNEIISVSSTKMFGFEDLYSVIQQVFMGGEDLTPD